MPLTCRDRIWLDVATKLAEKDRYEAQCLELKAQRRRDDFLFALLADLRYIQLAKIPFKNNADFQNFVNGLPSGKDKEKPTAQHWKVKKRKPGELPEWKKKKLEGQTTDGNGKL